MDYQAPVLLLATAGSMALFYGWFCWRQKVASIKYPCLVLLIGDQEQFLEGLLRHFFFWCYWGNSLWRLQIVAEQPSEATLAILRHFLYCYSSCEIICPGQGAPLALQPLANLNEPVHFLDIREETNFKAALTGLYHVYQTE